MGGDELNKNSWTLRQSNTKTSLLAQKNVHEEEEVYFQAEMTFTPCLLGNVLLFQWHTLVGKQPLKFWADLHSLQENLSNQLQPPFSRWELVIAFVLQALPFAPTKLGESCFFQTTGAHRSLTPTPCCELQCEGELVRVSDTKLCPASPPCWPLHMTVRTPVGTVRYKPLTSLSSLLSLQMNPLGTRLVPDKSPGNAQLGLRVQLVAWSKCHCRLEDFCQKMVTFHQHGW